MVRTSPAAAARAAMPQRYGRPRRSGRILVVTGTVLLAAAGLAWLGWTARWHASPDVAAAVTAYEVVSSSRTDITLEVRRRVTGAVRCHVFAQAEDTAIVGEREVRLDSAGPGTLTTTVAITTERRATTALVRECVLD